MLINNFVVLTHRIENTEEYDCSFLKRLYEIAESFSHIPEGQKPFVIYWRINNSRILCFSYNENYKEFNPYIFIYDRKLERKIFAVEEDDLNRLKQTYEREIAENNNSTIEDINKQYIKEQFTYLYQQSTSPYEAVPNQEVLLCRLQKLDEGYDLAPKNKGDYHQYLKHVGSKTPDEIKEAELQFAKEQEDAINKIDATEHDF